MEKKEERPTRKPVRIHKKKIDKQLYWVIGVMIGLIMIFLVANYFFKNINSFTYEGLAFTKEKFGEIPVYHHYYYYTDKNNPDNTIKYNLYLRHDPRYNPVSIDADEILFSQDMYNYISINGTGLTECEYSSAAIASLTSFLTNNQLPVKGSTVDYELANQTGIEYVTCETNPENPVMIIQSGNETKIVKTGNNCYEITASSCEIMQAVEKFEIEALLDARERASSLN